MTTEEYAKRIASRGQKAARIKKTRLTSEERDALIERIDKYASEVHKKYFNGHARISPTSAISRISSIGATLVEKGFPEEVICSEMDFIARLASSLGARAARYLAHTDKVYDDLRYLSLRNALVGMEGQAPAEGEKHERVAPLEESDMHRPSGNYGIPSAARLAAGRGIDAWHSVNSGALLREF